MAKKFKFKLEALKKLKDFNEHKVKIEIGKINNEMAKVKSMLAQFDKDLDVNYDSHEKVAEKGSNARLMKFYPMFTEGKNAQIQKYTNILYALEKKYHDLLEQLREKRGESKLMNNLKQKEHLKFKKDKNKKMEQKIQDNYLITRGMKDEK